MVTVMVSWGEESRGSKSHRLCVITKAASTLSVSPFAYVLRAISRDLIFFFLFH